MKNPPPATQEGTDWFYRQLVQSDFMKNADEQGFPIGFEALHLRKDFLDQGVEPYAFMEHRFDAGADQTVLGYIHRCIGKTEFVKLRSVTPRYLRCTRDIDCRMCPTAINCAQIPCWQKGMRLGYLRVPPMEMPDINKHLKSGICSLHGGPTRMDLRYCTPDIGNALNGINQLCLGLVRPSFRTAM